ncbi:sulfotransferase family 2 domain-containing protein [Histidinibacterium lentulum]|uniref:Sulfotransferase family protein n=1 Tax=Histidinibacterium lentulum TaxID=2480588 RepID=A0A3N2R6H5_9RHOB|nr:sulfotransferase family 2 domain-containing protein [Histidinibacterium lentulum]ROU02981.1 hypothetical protein EAT49_06695 [Histidinibacterium lentulum]
MPLFRASGKLVYFAHVPKCGGTSVEHYLSARFGPLGLWDPFFALRSRAAAWSRSPPQHMPEAVRRDLIPDGLFDASFALVRHPVARLNSVFLFQSEIEKAVPRAVTFSRWLDLVERELETNPYQLHGHLLPTGHFVPETATVFRLEDGIDRIIPWLDRLSNTVDGPRSMPRSNVLIDRLKHEGADPPQRAGPSTADIERIGRLYAEDFARFGYGPDPDRVD